MQLLQGFINDIIEEKFKEQKTGYEEDIVETKMVCKEGKVWSNIT